MKRKRDEKLKEKSEFESLEEEKLIYGRIEPEMIENSIFYIDPGNKSVKRL
jgi:hypothetical protein